MGSDEDAPKHTRTKAEWILSTLAGTATVAGAGVGIGATFGGAGIAGAAVAAGLGAITTYISQERRLRLERQSSGSLRQLINESKIGDSPSAELVRAAEGELDALTHEESDDNNELK